MPEACSLLMPIYVWLLMYHTRWRSTVCIIYLMNVCDKFSLSNWSWMHSENTQGEAKKYRAPLIGGSDVRWVQPSVGDILGEGYAHELHIYIKVRPYWIQFELKKRGRDQPKKIKNTNPIWANVTFSFVYLLSHNWTVWNWLKPEWKCFVFLFFVFWNKCSN